jgi:dihydrofolate reductase/thymidylate synthase
MNSYQAESGYLQLLSDTINDGEYRSSRNGNVFSRFGIMITFTSIFAQFPLLTTKKMFIKGIVEELLWFLRGSTNAKELQDKGIHIWDGNSSREYLDSIGLAEYKEGELGPVYGWQWRCFGKSYKTDKTDGVDQIRYILEELMKPDNSRRAVLSAWNPQQLHQMALPPCHIMYTFYKDSNGLSCMMNMRSSDLFLGLPFNIASTAVLTHIFAALLHIKPNTISLVLSDAHIYEEHVEAINKQVHNAVLSPPVLNIKKEPPSIDSTVDDKLKWIEDLVYEDFIFDNYKSASSIKAIMK